MNPQEANFIAEDDYREPLTTDDDFTRTKTYEVEFRCSYIVMDVEADNEEKAIDRAYDILWDYLEPENFEVVGVIEIDD
jgi:hypothetical protein